MIFSKYPSNIVCMNYLPHSVMRRMHNIKQISCRFLKQNNAFRF